MKSKTTKLSQKQLFAIIERYLDGESATEIAPDFGVGASTVRYHLLKNDIEIRSQSESAALFHEKRRPLSKEQQLKAEALYKKGFSAAKIASLIGTNQPVIWRHLKQLGISRSYKEARWLRYINKPEFQERIEKVVRLHFDEGLSRNAIAAKLGLCWATVDRLLKAYLQI